ncbi:MAG: hypothetical protein ACTHLO_20755 [Pseudolabrys sp.]
MKTGWLAVAFAAAALVAADPALARPRKAPPKPPQCVDRPVEFSWLGILTNERPTANGCAPAVGEFGQYIGQDPDPNIRAALRRQPQTGYESDLMK